MERSHWIDGRSIAIPMLREASPAELGLIRLGRTGPSDAAGPFAPFRDPRPFRRRGTNGRG